MVTIKKYTAADKLLWDCFVKDSKNGTFLLMRDYMDYHADRFEDCSLMFFHNNKLIALLPLAERKDIGTEVKPDPRTIISHPGLTYGGLIMNRHCTSRKVCEIFDALMAFMKEQGYSYLIYKAIPHDYHKYPSEEDLYALTAVCRAELSNRDISAVIDLSKPFPWRKGKHANMTAAKREGITVMESEDFASFWQILEENLYTKYNSKPVHTLQEIVLLHKRFPHNIKLLLAEKEGKILSGAVLYITDTCVHVQYLNSSEEGNRHHCNELVIDYILNNFSHLHYFDYGTSADNGTYGLNESLISSKEGYGCRGIVYDTYKIKLCNNT